MSCQKQVRSDEHEFWGREAFQGFGDRQEQDSLVGFRDGSHDSEMMPIMGEDDFAVVDSYRVAVDRRFQALLEMFDVRCDDSSKQVELDSARWKPGQALQGIFEFGLE